MSIIARIINAPPLPSSQILGIGYDDEGDSLMKADKPPEVDLPLTDKIVIEEGAVPPTVTAAAVTAAAVENGGKWLAFFGQGARDYDLEDFLKASAEILGKGTFGTAYKVVLDMGTLAVVKRLKG